MENSASSPSQGAAPAVPQKQIAGTEMQQSAATSYIYQNYQQSGEAWVQPGLSLVAVVFVHGFTGDYHDTWTWKSRWPFWRRRRTVNLLGGLLTSEADLPCDYYSFSHPSGNFDKARVADIANSLRTFLDANVAKGPGKRRVILVSHSLGGVVCRQAVLDQIELAATSRVQIIGLLMMGTPNLGTDVARIALRSRSGADIKSWSAYLEDLNRNWLRRVVNGGDPDRPPAERVRLKCGVLYGLKDRVVPAASSKSGVYLGELNAVNKGHIAMPKCKDKGDLVYGVLTNFIRRSLLEADQDRLQQSAVDLCYRARRHILDESSEWTKEESEQIQLAPHPTLAPEVLNCTITSTRIGWQPRSEVAVCLQLANTPPPAGIHLDYKYILGRGALTQEEYAKLGSSLLTITQEEFDKLLKVEVQLARIGSGQEQKVELQAPELTTGPGYAVWRRALQQPGSLGRDNRLTITLQTTVWRHQAWYGYRSTRTVLGNTVLQITAPFRLYPLSTFWWSDAKWKNEEVGNYFSSGITISEPFPIGTDVIWLFEPEARKA